MSSVAQRRAAGSDDPVEPLPAGNKIDLRYVARTGLLPELTRQTYDSFPKAIREAVLNALDAGAERVEIDFSRAHDGEMVVADDGAGMTIREFADQFMSLGGSGKFGDTTKFGKIGIGSLALLQYGAVAIIESKKAGAHQFTRATVEHPWSFARERRVSRLETLPAGVAEECPYDGPKDDHFTRIRIVGLRDDIRAIAEDPSEMYGLIENLRRILPLPWCESPLAARLAADAPDLVATLRAHLAEWSKPVVVHASWERDIHLRRRCYGDDPAGSEQWGGVPIPVEKNLRVRGPSGTRIVKVAGFLLSQLRADARWSGISAHVQNVVVEDRTFFDVTADPGFRKYITGEVWLLGDLDRERLINIDRSSFNREAQDYKVVQRYLAAALLDFKATGVQQPQRRRVAARRIIEAHLSAARAIRKVVSHAAETLPQDGRSLPRSEPRRGRFRSRRDLVDALRDEGISARIDDSVVNTGGDDLGYKLITASDGEICALLSAGLAQPVATYNSVAYRIVYAAGGTLGAPVVIRTRPREIVLNLDHPAHARAPHQSAPISVAIELAYLSSASDAADM